MLDVSLGTLNDGFTGMVVLLNLVAGAAYSAAGALAYWNSKISFGEAKERAFKDFQDLTAKSDEYYQRADALAMGFESKRKIAADEISKTQKQKNAERLANFKKTLEELQAQEEKHKSGIEKNSELNSCFNDWAFFSLLDENITAEILQKHINSSLEIFLPPPERNIA